MYIVQHLYSVHIFVCRNKKKVRYTEYYLIFSTITCIPDIVEVCALGALNTPIFSSETLLDLMPQDSNPDVKLLRASYSFVQSILFKCVLRI